MSDIIKVLSVPTSNQISAGEVVKRPASVVKELMENSIDAKSEMIIVNVEAGGTELIQIIDDGVGMSYNDAFAAFERHATSKIKKTEDLYRLSTFGFRGVALTLIASVSDVELKTRKEEDEIGCKVLMCGGEFLKHIPEATDKGTQISVKKLFFNVPERRKFLKSLSIETKHIISEFKKIALCNPQIAMFLYSNKKMLYNLQAGNLRRRVNDIIGKSINHQLMQVNVETSIVTIKGYIGSPETAVQSPEQFMFVNGRYFKTTYFNRAITRAYEKTLVNQKVMPRYFLYFTLSPMEIDVNADPEKVDVRFENESQIWEILYNTIKAVLAKNGINPSIDFESGMQANTIESFGALAEEHKDSSPFNPFGQSLAFLEGSEPDDFEKDPRNTQLYESESEVFVSSFSDDDFTEEEGEVPSEEFVYEPTEIVSTSFGQTYFEDAFDGFESSKDEFFSTAFSSGGDSVEKPSTPFKMAEESFFEEINNVQNYDLTQLGRCSLFADKYIVAPIGDQLIFINMLAALWRISYDKYLSMVKTGSSGAVTKLVFPETISLSVTHKAIIDDCKADLESLGFAIVDSQTAGAIDIVGVPSGYDKYDPYEVFEDILEYISGDDIEGYNEQKQERLIYRLSSVESAKRAKSLNRQEYDMIVRELFACENYRKSPKGKPIFAELNRSNIDSLLK